MALVSEIDVASDEEVDDATKVDIVGVTVLELNKASVEVVVETTENPLAILDVENAGDAVDEFERNVETQSEELVEVVEGQVVEFAGIETADGRGRDVTVLVVLNTEETAKGRGRDVTVLVVLKMEENTKEIALLTFAVVFVDEAVVALDFDVVDVDLVDVDAVDVVLVEVDLVDVDEVDLALVVLIVDVFVVDDLMLVELVVLVTLAPFTFEVAEVVAALDVNCAPQTALFSSDGCTESFR